MDNDSAHALRQCRAWRRECLGRKLRTCTHPQRQRKAPCFTKKEEHNAENQQQSLHPAFRNVVACLFAQPVVSTRAAISGQAKQSLCSGRGCTASTKFLSDTRNVTIKITAQKLCLCCTNASSGTKFATGICANTDPRTIQNVGSRSRHKPIETKMERREREMDRFKSQADRQTETNDEAMARALQEEYDRENRELRQAQPRAVCCDVPSFI